MEADRLESEHALATEEFEDATKAAAEAAEALKAAETRELNARAKANAARQKREVARRKATSARRWADRWAKPWMRIIGPAAALAAGFLVLVLIASNAGGDPTPAPQTTPPVADIGDRAPPTLGDSGEAIGLTRSMNASAQADAERQVAEFKAEDAARETAERVAAQVESERRAAAQADAERQADELRVRLQAEADEAARTERIRNVNAICARVDAESQAAEFRAQSGVELTAAEIETAGYVGLIKAACELGSEDARLTQVEAAQAEADTAAAEKARIEAENQAAAEAAVKAEEERIAREAEAAAGAEAERQRRASEAAEAERRRAAGCNDPSVSAYQNKMADVARPAGQAFTKLGSLMAQAGSSPLLLFTDEWIFQVAAQLVILDLSADEMLALSPPPSRAKAHEHVVAAARAMKNTVTSITAGIDNLDVDQMSRAAGYIAEAGSEIELASAETARQQAIC